MSTEFDAPTPEAVGEFFDEVDHIVLPLWNGNMHHGYWLGPDDDSTFERASERFTQFMIDKVGAAVGDRVLDLGCGTGKPGLQLARATSAEVVGISISTEDVRLANELAVAEGMQDSVRFEYANALALPYPDDSFDHVMAFETVPHIADRVQVLKEIARALRPGGRVVLTDFIVRGFADDLSEADVQDVEKVIAEVLGAWRKALPVKIDDYPQFAEQAGLVIDEIVDVTDNTKFTSKWTFLSLYEYAQNHEVPPALTRVLDAGPGRETMRQWAEHVEDDPSEGVAVVVAHLPRQ